MTDHPTSIEAQDGSGVLYPMADASRRTEPTSSMTTEEWDAAIARATAAEAGHDVQWMLTGCFAAKGNADRAKHLKESLIAARSHAA